MSFVEWRLRTRSLSNEQHTIIMGVVNVTSDSFSDGGLFLSPASAVAHGRRLVAEGADIVDVGGESTRPGADSVSTDEELSRVVPVVRALADDGTIVSIDTSKADVAVAAISAGAEIINDISALSDPAMAGVAADAGTGLVLMHRKGSPTTMQDDPRYADVTSEVRDMLVVSAKSAESAGVDPERICLDPGIGFGKTLGHNLTLLRNLDVFVSTGYPVLLGTSRKAFLGAVTGLENARDRDGPTSATTAIAIAEGVFGVRVHNVPLNLQSARVADAIVRSSNTDEGTA